MWEIQKVIMDSGCSLHMTCDKSKFLLLTSIDGGHVTFGENAKRKAIGKGTVGKSKHSYVKDVLLVNGLRHNLLSIS